MLEYVIVTSPRGFNESAREQLISEYKERSILNESDNFIIKQKKFIFELYKNNRFFDCIAETQRLLSYRKDIKNRKQFIYFINTCYYSGDQYKTVITRLQNSTDKKKEFPLHNLFLLSQSYFNIGYHKLGIELLKKIDWV